MTTETKRKLNITPGPWMAYNQVGNHILKTWRVRSESDDQPCGICHMDESLTGDQQVANAELLAEAGTVANETGLTPRQLADQRAELLEKLQRLVAMHDDCVFICGGGDAPLVERVLRESGSAIARATA
jgi:hypothetical protein